MKGFCEKIGGSKCYSKSSTNIIDSIIPSVSLEAEACDSKLSKAPLWSSFFTSAFSVFQSDPSTSEKKPVHSRSGGWTAAVRKVVTSGSMWRIHERVLGSSRADVSSSGGEIWLLGVNYKISENDSSGNADSGSCLAAFEHDFFSRILMTYRKGFDAIGDSKYTSDVNWGCMLRSSQMLIAQAFLFHRLGRSWRKPTDKPLDQGYVDILHDFGDSETVAFSLHNLLQAGKGYGLAAGSWVGPYAMCRTWETLARRRCNENDEQLPFAIYVVSGDEDGERGGAPVVCVEDATKHCSEFSRGQADWMPLLLLVPLVLGLDEVNPRYIPVLRSTFTFPQSLGILGGKPGASTYIIGAQGEKALYLDPHEVQPVVNISTDSLEANTSSYHCNIIRQIPLESIDPSLAIGFYCRDKDDFDDFCLRASKLAEESNGAPLFTVTQAHSSCKPVNCSGIMGENGNVKGDNSDSCGVTPMNDAVGVANEDDWQFL